MLQRVRMRWPIRIKVAASGAVVAFLISLFVGLYYPAQYRKEALDARREQVAGTAEMVAMSVGAALRLNVPSSVAAAFAWARRDSALVYLAVVDTSDAVFATFNRDSLPVDPVQEAGRGDMHEWRGLLFVAAPIALSRRHPGDSGPGFLAGTNPAADRPATPARPGSQPARVRRGWTCCRSSSPVASPARSCRCVARPTGWRPGDYDVVIPPDGERRNRGAGVGIRDDGGPDPEPGRRIWGTRPGNSRPRATPRSRPPAPSPRSSPS